MAIYVAVVSGMTSCEEGDLTRLETILLSQEGIVGLTGTDLEVQEQATPDMSVKVKKGACFVLRDAYVAADNTLKFWHVVVTDDTNVTISNNSSGNPRIDRICVKVDTGVSPDATASNVASLVAVEGTPAASPSAPAVPDNHLSLAQVYVADGETAINTSDITDERQFVGLQLPHTEGYRLKDTGGSLDGRIYEDTDGIIRLKSGKSGGFVGIDPETNKVCIKGYAGGDLLKFPNSDGSADQVLKTDGAGTLSFGSVSGGATEAVRIKRTTNQSISDSTETAIQWESEDFDTDNMADLTTNNTRITIKTAGKYIVAYNFVWAANTTGRRYSYLKKNGTTNLVQGEEALGTNGDAAGSHSTILDLAVNDYLEVIVAQTSGAALNILGVQPNSFSAHRLS